MTDRGKKGLQIAGVTLLPLVIGAATAWATTQYRVGDLEKRFGLMEQRISDIYCATVPVNVRQGCR